MTKSSPLSPGDRTGAPADVALAERDFQSPDWSLGNVLSWIAFRDPALIRWYVGCWVWFTSSGSAVTVAPPEKITRDPEPPRMLLLAALKTGKVTVIKGGEILQREWWFGLETRHLSSDLRFRREQVLGLWPAKVGNGREAGLPTESAKPAVATRPPPVTKPKLKKFMEDVHAKGGKSPAVDTRLLEMAVEAFPGYQVTRVAVRAVAQEVFGRQAPGPRK